MARLSCRVGLAAALERWAARPGAIVLTYHRVGDASRTPFDSTVFSATAEGFDQQIAFVKRRYPIVPLDEVVNIIEQPSRMRRRTVVAVTFDDGYRDSYTTAFPILRRHGVPATFFVVTGWTGSATVPWWDAIAFMVRRSKSSSIAIAYPTPKTIALAGDRTAAIREVLRVCKSVAVDDIARFVVEVSRASGVQAPSGDRDRPRFLTWDEAREMQTYGMTFGSHTHTHPILAKLTRRAQVDELRTSAMLLRSELGVERPTLAFPVGSNLSFNAETESALGEAGYRAAFTLTGGVTRGSTDRFGVSRVPVDRADATLLRMRMAAVSAGASAWGVPL